jgi:glycosyltransferase involved in cell wall biosynthesis
MHMLKIHSLVLDARMMRHSGIGVYIRNLIPYLNQAFDMSLIGDSKALEPFDCKIIDCKIGVYSPKELYKIAVLAGKSDVFWTPHFNYPLWPVKAKLKLATVYDMYHLAHFDKLSFPQKLYAKLVIDHTLRKVDKVFTISEFTKNEIIKYFPKVDSEKLEVIQIGVDTDFFRPEPDLSKIDTLKSKYHLPDKYVLFVGNLKHNKNAIALVKAMQALETRKQLHEHKLVITGKKDGFRIGDNEVVDYIITHKLEHLVHFTGFVDDLDLPVLYSAASLFVFPSIYEGFGLPPLEAISCGCPVVCSSMASMPEVCGESVFYFDPQQEESLVSILADLLNNEDLKRSKANYAKQWIEQYDWSITAEKHIKLINDAYSKK